jgi:hypothetical protein
MWYLYRRCNRTGSGTKALIKLAQARNEVFTLI